MRELPLNAIRAFATMYATGGVRPAARRLGVAHSSVSRHLAELEAWLGISLVMPAGGRRRLTFTPQGKVLGEVALATLQELETVTSSLREARFETSVQIGTHPSFAARWLLPRLPALEASKPHIELSVIVDRRLAEVESTDLDLAITMGPRRTREDHWQCLMGDELYPVMSPSFWKAHGKPSRPRDLLGLRLLHDRDPDAAWGEWRSVHGPEKLDVRKGPRFTSTDLVLRAAAKGHGVALARHQLAVEEIDSGQLLRPLGDLKIEIDEGYWIVLPRHKLPSPATRSVIDWLMREASG
ncbi:MAG: LysR family transcriptional regulator [Acidobacteria bacterium]|nr:LysR family transcriptional regulator [Acidobacteriota bacterium]